MLESSQKEHLNTGEQLTKHAMLFFIITSIYFILETNIAILVA
jgi:hypothetical protein